MGGILEKKAALLKLQASLQAAEMSANVRLEEQRLEEQRYDAERVNDRIQAVASVSRVHAQASKTVELFSTPVDVDARDPSAGAEGAQVALGEVLALATL